jgi:hypothetical protein
MTAQHNHASPLAASVTLLSFGLLLGSPSSCSKPIPPAADNREVSPSAVSASPIGPLVGSSSVSAHTTHDPESSVLPADTGTTPTMAPAETESAPPLLDAHDNPLPQTEERPELSPSFERRLKLLVDAIAHNTPESALPAFFPKLAYVQVKAIKDPGSDWERRLVAAFRRNIAEYHRHLGPNAETVTFVRLDLPEAKVKWIKPGVEGNRVGYYRVTRAKLVVAKGDGREVVLELTSLISWRGEWYVVHLHGFE